MFFSRQIPLTSLIALCRVLRHHLQAGLTLVQVFRQQGERGPYSFRPIARRMAESLGKGENLASVLENEKDFFPPLFLALAQVGEDTGHLPEIFKELEEYFSLQLKLRRQFWAQAMLPIIQFVLALLILAGLIMVLGMIAASNPGQEPPKVLGQSGARGALAFLFLCFGTLTLVWIGFRILKQVFQKSGTIDALLLRLPALGPCLEALAMNRFTLALSLTLDTSLSPVKAVRLALQASGNGAYLARIPQVVQSLKQRSTLTEALAQSQLFSDDFISITASAEEAGSVPEMMRQQAAYYQEETSRRMTSLTKLAGMGIWLLYALFMIAAIFHVAGMYLGALKGK